MIKTIAKPGLFERISIRLTRIIGSPISLILHTIAFGGFFILRDLGFVSNNAFLILTAAVCLEAIYMVIFVQMLVNRTTKGLMAAEESITRIQEEENETHKLMVHILHLAHQMKTLQQDVEYLKKGSFKRTNGNGHRVQA